MDQIILRCCQDTDVIYSLSLNRQREYSGMLFAMPLSLQCSIALQRKPYFSLSMRVQSDDELSSITFSQGIREPVVEPKPDLKPKPPLKKPRFKEMPSREHIYMWTRARVEETTTQQTVLGVRLFRG